MPELILNQRIADFVSLLIFLGNEKNMFYNIKILEKVWMGNKKGVTLHSLSAREVSRSGGRACGERENKVKVKMV